MKKKSSWKNAYRKKDDVDISRAQNEIGWGGRIRTSAVQGSKPCALPLGDTPKLSVYIQLPTTFGQSAISRFLNLPVFYAEGID